WPICCVPPHAACRLTGSGSTRIAASRRASGRRCGRRSRTLSLRRRQRALALTDDPSCRSLFASALSRRGRQLLLPLWGRSPHELEGDDPACLTLPPQALCAGFMKRALRLSAVQAILSWLVGSYLILVLRTTRWELHGTVHLAPFAAGGGT